MGTFEVGLNASCLMILFQDYGARKWNGSRNIVGPHNLIGNGNIRRCGFVGVGMALLEEVSFVQDTSQCLN